MSSWAIFAIWIGGILFLQAAIVFAFLHFAH